MPGVLEAAEMTALFRDRPLVTASRRTKTEQSSAMSKLNKVEKLRIAGAIAPVLRKGRGAVRRIVVVTHDGELHRDDVSSSGRRWTDRHAVSRGHQTDASRAMPKIAQPARNMTPASRPLSAIAQVGRDARATIAPMA